MHLLKSILFRWFNIFFICCGLLFSCSTVSPNKPKPVGVIKDSEKIIFAWDINKISVSDSGSFVPTIDENVIFTADSSGSIFRIDINDGTIINKIQLDSELSSGTAISSDSIFVTTTSGYLLSLNKLNGKIKWKVKLPTISIEAPQILSNIVVVKVNDAGMIACNAENGKLLWYYQTSAPTLTVRAYNTFQIIAPDVLINGEPEGKLSLLNLLNGNVIWENTISVPSGATDIDKLTDIVSRPVIKDKQICAVSFNGKIACIDVTSNNIMWEKFFSSDKAILLDEQNIYAVNVDGIVSAFDRYTGSVVWENSDLEFHSLGSPVFLGNNVLIVENDGYINLLNRGDGKLVSRVKSNLKDGVSLPWSDGSRVIIQSGNGHIAKITQ